MSIKCESKLCIYWENNKCTVNEIDVNENGLCITAITVTPSDEILDKLRLPSPKPKNTDRSDVSCGERVCVYWRKNGVCGLSFPPEIDEAGFCSEHMYANTPDEVLKDLRKKTLDRFDRLCDTWEMGENISEDSDIYF